jgi:hypothetical protein
MSERYGAPGELQDLLENFEDWVRDEINKAREEMKAAGTTQPFTVGRLDTLRDVLAWWGIDD